MHSGDLFTELRHTKREPASFQSKCLAKITPTKWKAWCLVVSLPGRPMTQLSYQVVAISLFGVSAGSVLTPAPNSGNRLGGVSQKGETRERDLREDEGRH